MQPRPVTAGVLHVSGEAIEGVSGSVAEQREVRDRDRDERGAACPAHHAMANTYTSAHAQLDRVARDRFAARFDVRLHPWNSRTRPRVDRCTIRVPMFPRARRDTPFLALLIGVVVAAVPASARSNGVPRNDRDPYMALLETGVRSDVDPLPRPDRQTPPLGPTAPTTALRPEACGPKPVAFLPDLARRPHDPLCTGDPATMPARCIDAQREMHWDEEDRLASVHGSDADMEFRYDADGERTHRVSLRRNDVTSYLSRFHSVRNEQFAMNHVFAGSERVATVMFNVPPAGGPGCDPTIRTCIITHLPPDHGPPGTIGSPRTTLWYHTDHLQSTNYVTDARGRVTEHLEYFPFGEQWVEEQTGASSDTVPYRFTGHDWDSETRLYYAGARYYDPRQGQWLGADPAISGMLRTGSASAFVPARLWSTAYVRNNPIGRRDPTGLQDPPRGAGPEPMPETPPNYAGQRWGPWVAVRVEGREDPSSQRSIPSHTEWVEDRPDPRQVLNEMMARDLQDFFSPLADVLALAASLYDLAHAAAPHVQYARARLSRPPAPTVTFGEPSRADLRMVATAIRDEEAARIMSQPRSAAQRRSIPPMVSASYSQASGTVAVGVAPGGGSGCSEPACAAAHGDPPDIQFTPSIRPRTGIEYGPCSGCRERYPGAFEDPMPPPPSGPGSRN